MAALQGTILGVSTAGVAGGAAAGGAAAAVGASPAGAAASLGLPAPGLELQSFIRGQLGRIEESAWPQRVPRASLPLH